MKKIAKSAGMLLLLSFSLAVVVEGRVARAGVSFKTRSAVFAGLRGGDNKSNITTIEEYAAAMAAKDAAQQRQQDTFHEEDETQQAEGGSEGPEVRPAGDEENSAVGVKAHSKKSNAVGDPDGEGSDTSDDDSDIWEEFEEEMDMLSRQHQTDASTAQVQVEVELVEDDQVDFDESDENVDTVSGGGGGVGVKLGNRLNRRKNKNGSRSRFARIGQKQLLEAWQPFVFLPPSSAAMTYLKDRARLIDGASKSRLDRRTLYACLMLEWMNASSTYRKFLDKASSQALQSALSLATQPEWRKVLPRPSGIRLYDEEPDRGCTLAMQESIALALAHSLGAGLVMLDDATLSSIRQQLLRNGYCEADVKPAVLIQSLLELAREGKLRSGTSGCISTCMRKDLLTGLDDPFDERATVSCQEMEEWEQKWVATESEGESKEQSTLPLVIFVRTQGSRSLLKSKSAVETLLHECNSATSCNLIILGKGIDAKTATLPEESVRESPEMTDGPARNMPGGSPWFGFSSPNQNASGQNDPEGSRRFNIFLARTVDADGTPGILGAIAPPQAGNLFPHMMAMQASERMQQQGGDDDNPIREQLERWAQMLQEQMQSSGTSFPPPQMFKASITTQFEGKNLPPGAQPPPPPPEVIQQTLQTAMSELLDRLAEMTDDAGEGPTDPSTDVHKAFAQVLRNENLRRGIAENLSRAAPALSDPKCQGVMLSVYVPPPPTHMNRGQLPSGPSKQLPGMSNWFQKILNNQEEDESSNGDDEARKKSAKQKRVRTLAAAAAMSAATKNAESPGQKEKNDNKAERNLSRLEAICRPIVAKSPADPVRAKSWDAWIGRERGSVIFRQNRQVLNKQLEKYGLLLQEHTGTRGAGSSLRQMLSVRDISDEMEEVIKCVVELEAAKSQRQHESPAAVRDNEMTLDVDITLSQLLLTEDGLIENSEEVLSTSDLALRASKRSSLPGAQYIHPSSLESALTHVCRISPSPSGGLSLSSGTASHRTREEIMALAQDKHERALVSQVVSPQDIGVTYDMIGGLSEVKELLRQSITYPLKFPHLYSEGIAREAVKGVLLFGPPGTGKTMLAKAVATEGGASFLSVDASSVENKWLGESEKNAKAVFTLARRLAPCVIFIDEVDSLLSSREGTSDDSAHGTLTSVKTTMMSEWDGLNSGTNGAGEAGSDRVVVIGSTNRPFDLDEAVLRRFPRRILVDLPDLETRKEILEVTLAENRMDPAVNLTKIAERLEGYTGSDIKEVCREAVVQISHEQARLLDQGFENTKEDVTQGSLQRLRPVTVEDFEKALSKLKRSVSEKGRELARVWEWNDEYGEIKKEKKNHLPHLANMYL